MAAFKALIPLDGSAFSRQVLPYVRRLLNPQDYSLILLHVAPLPEDQRAPQPPPIILDGWTGIMDERAWEAERAGYSSDAGQVWDGFKAELLDEMGLELQRLQQAGFDTAVVVRFGEPTQEIVDLVEEEEVALVVMATHGRTGLGRMVMGSVAEKVLRSLRVPVMMVRPLREGADERLPLGYLVNEGA